MGTSYTHAIYWESGLIPPSAIRTSPLNWRQSAQRSCANVSKGSDVRRQYIFKSANTIVVPSATNCSTCAKWAGVGSLSGLSSSVISFSFGHPHRPFDNRAGSETCLAEGFIGRFRIDFFAH